MSEIPEGGSRNRELRASDRFASESNNRLMALLLRLELMERRLPAMEHDALELRRLLSRCAESVERWRVFWRTIENDPPAASAENTEEE